MVSVWLQHGISDLMVTLGEDKKEIEASGRSYVGRSTCEDGSIALRTVIRLSRDRPRSCYQKLFHKCFNTL